MHVLICRTPPKTLPCIRFGVRKKRNNRAIDVCRIAECMAGRHADTVVMSTMQDPNQEGAQQGDHENSWGDVSSARPVQSTLCPMRQNSSSFDPWSGSHMGKDSAAHPHLLLLYQSCDGRLAPTRLFPPVSFLAGNSCSRNQEFTPAFE